MQKVYLACCITMVYETSPVACITVNRTLTHVVSHQIMKLIVPSSAKAQIRASWCELHGTQHILLTAVPLWNINYLLCSSRQKFVKFAFCPGSFSHRFKLCSWHVIESFIVLLTFHPYGCNSSGEDTFEWFHSFTVTMENYFCYKFLRTVKECNLDRQNRKHCIIFAGSMTHIKPWVSVVQLVVCKLLSPLSRAYRVFSLDFY